MNVIKFEAHLIELDDLVYIQEHIESHSPCVAFYQVIYPEGKTPFHFVAVADNGHYTSCSVSQNMYDLMISI